MLRHHLVFPPSELPFRIEGKKGNYLPPQRKLFESQFLYFYHLPFPLLRFILTVVHTNIFLFETAANTKIYFSKFILLQIYFYLKLLFSSYKHFIFNNKRIFFFILNFISHYAVQDRLNEEMVGKVFL